MMGHSDSYRAHFKRQRLLSTNTCKPYFRFLQGLRAVQNTQYQIYLLVAPAGGWKLVSGKSQRKPSRLTFIFAAMEAFLLLDV